MEYTAESATMSVLYTASYTPLDGYLLLVTQSTFGMHAIVECNHNHLSGATVRRLFLTVVVGGSLYLLARDNQLRRQLDISRTSDSWSITQ